MTSSESQTRFSRRQILQMFTAVSTGIAASSDAATVGIADTFAKGYGTDPVLTKLYKPGDVWPLTLDAEQRRAVTALCDLILPADDLGPAASAVAVPEFMDEWVSAPYPLQQLDRLIILEGIAWLNAEATKRYSKPFADLSDAEQAQIADDICDTRSSKPELKAAALFFEKFRSLASAGYYSTQEGWKAIGFVGNITSATFDGPPAEVLKLLDVEQTVK
jgi:Gluconate 2-dehydrogenase subunit 3